MAATDRPADTTRWMRCALCGGKSYWTVLKKARVPNQKCFEKAFVANLERIFYGFVFTFS